MPETSVDGDGSDPNSDSGSLFQGKQFWLSHNIPQRSRFKEIIQQNGGIIRLQEKDADIKLVDHTKRNLPPGTFSFKYVEDSVRKGRLQDLEAYRAGPSAARPVGATYIPSRGHKILYTLQDDQILWDWMQPYAKQPQAPIRGNKIYQDLAAEHPRHTFQSYRDRYLKRLHGRPRPGGMPESIDRPPASHESTERKSPSHIISTPEAHERPRNESALVPSKPENRKRKRVPETEAPDGPESEIIGGPSQKRRAPEILSESITSVMSNTHASDSEIHGQPANLTTPRPNNNNAIRLSKDPKTGGTEGPAQSQEIQTPINESATAIDNVWLELPFFPSASPEPEEESFEQDIDAWIDDRLRTNKAENEAHVIVALQCTSMDPRLADNVIDHLNAGKGIPEDMPGVWTAEDDKCVEGKNARDIDRILKKHGPETFNARWEYLGMARAAGLEENTNE